MSQTSRFSIGGHPLPLDLHTVWTDENGRPLSIGGELIKFDFVFRDVRYSGRYEDDGVGASMKVVGDLGPMPFSAESPAARAGLSRVMDVANAELGPIFKVTLGRIVLGCETPLPHPVTATSLVSALALFLIPAIPYMDLIGVYVAPPLAARKPGESALRPEWRRRK